MIYVSTPEGKYGDNERFKLNISTDLKKANDTICAILNDLKAKYPTGIDFVITKNNKMPIGANIDAVLFFNGKIGKI
jgi:hypothetical protein